MDRTNKMHIISKFAVIGRGSTYTPELLDGFITHQDQVRVDSISLYDIQPQRLEILRGLVQRMIQRAGLSTRIELHPSTRPQVEVVKTSDSLCIEVAVQRSKRLVRQAMWVNLPAPNYATAERITDEVLEAHQAYLPIFF